MTQEDDAEAWVMMATREVHRLVRQQLRAVSANLLAVYIHPRKILFLNLGSLHA
jgi:hypothetical protein